jgi:glycosyltransferase involved in cell wall biosynthesis
MGIPYIIEINGLITYESIESDPRYVPRIYLMTYSIIERFYLRMAYRVVAVTAGLQRYIHRTYRVPLQRISVIENAANTDLFRPMNAEACRKALNLDSSFAYVGFVGTLARWQGIEYLIKAAVKVIHEIPNVKFLIVGDGVMKSELVRMSKELQISNYIIFTGLVPYIEVPRYINACDICIVPKTAFNVRTGMSPLKLYEYLACGRPVIASDIEGLSDFLNRAQAGIIVPPERVEELSEAIIYLLKADNLRKEMGMRGRRAVVLEHSWLAVAQKIASLCELA